VTEALQDDRYLPVGYRKDNAEIYSLDFRQVYCCLIAGLRRSGKTSLLRLLIREALKKDCAGIALIDLSGKLKDLQGLSGLKLVTDHDAMYDYCMNDLTPVFQERNRKKHELIDQGLEEEDYYEAMASFKPVFVFISDLVLFMKEVYADTRNMKGFMETLFRKGEDHKISFIAALPLENRAEAAGYEAFSLFTQYRTGIHMGGNLSQDPYLSFDTVGFREQSKAELPGIAVVPEMATADQALKLVVPYAPRVKK
jgi:S-DNA-T family DNA segregation ATPase FtsK/SpoIIIE